MEAFNFVQISNHYFSLRVFWIFMKYHVLPHSHRDHNDLNMEATYADQVYVQYYNIYWLIAGDLIGYIIETHLGKVFLFVRRQKADNNIIRVLPLKMCYYSSESPMCGVTQIV